MPEGRFAGLDADLEGLAGEGYKVWTTPAGRTYAQARPGWLSYRIEVRGADHEGIIHEVAHYLSGGIDIDRWTRRRPRCLSAARPCSP